MIAPSDDSDYKQLPILRRLPFRKQALSLLSPRWYTISHGLFTSHTAKSATLPTSKLPCVSPKPIACAPTRVAPSSDSSGVRPKSVHPIFIFRSAEEQGAEPGLLLVAT